MATTLIPPEPAPALEKEAPVSDNHRNGNGFRGGDFDDWHGGPFDPHEFPNEPWSIPNSVYRAGMLVAIASVICVFATLTTVLRLRWAHSKDWVSLALPQGALYLNTLVLIASSVTLEFARFSLHRKATTRAAIYLYATLLLGISFVFGQYGVWREMVARGFYLASNPGSFFFYVLTATHGVHLLGGMAGLLTVAIRLRSFERKGLADTAVDVISLYWHFMDGLWIYLFLLLSVTVQR